MRFFLVARDPDNGAVRLIEDGTYPRRQDALDALGPAVDADASLEAQELYLVDLDQIAPVVLYRAAASAAPQGEPIADAWMSPAEEPTAPVETPEEPVAEEPVAEDLVVEEPTEEEPVAEELVVEEPVVEESTAEPTADEIAADVAVEEAVLEGPAPLWVPDESAPIAEAEPDGLADALRRAATRLESEGIVAPPSVEEFAARGSLGARTGESDVEVAAAEPADPEAVPVSTEVEVVELEAAGSWPWEAPAAADADALLDIEEPTDVEETDAPGVAAFEPVGIAEPGLEDVVVLTPVDESLPRPLIVGEYAIDSVTDAEDLTLSEIEELAGRLEGAAVAQPADDDESITDLLAEPTPEPPVEPVEEKVYEPGGLDISSYSCEDCVYVVTCPKAKQESPATCGSFQWKSV
jgi:hypothetical protein